MSHPLFGPEIKLMLLEGNVGAMRAFCESLQPSTVAETLAEDFSVEENWAVLSQTGKREQAAIFEYYPIAWQVRMVEGTGQANMARLIEQMSHDDRVDLLRRLEPRVAESLLRLVDEADRKDIASLFRFEENSVGAMMTTEYAWLPDTLNAGQAIDRLRQQAPDRETIYYLYILDEPTRRLMGVLSLKSIVLADRLTTLRSLMQTDLVTIRASETREVAAEAMARYDFIAMPVVDDEYRLVGIVTHDDALDVLREAATEDMQRQAGVGPFSESYLEASPWKLWWKRTFWLSCLFIAEMLTFNAMAAFEETLKSIFILSFFIPLCIATGGNSGTQAATLITRAMALGQITTRMWFRVLKRELLLGVMMGLALGVIGFVRTSVVSSEMLQNPDGSSVDRLMLMIVVGQGVAVICLCGTLIGAMLPIAFRKLNIDPALASSPFVATFVDVTGIVLFFGIARFWLM